MTVTFKRGTLLTALSFAALLVTVVSTHAQSCEPQNVATKYPGYAGKVVNIAATPTYPPFTYSDPTNPERLTGLETEIVESALNCAGLKYKYVLGPWTGILPTIFTGSTDVAIGNVNYRADRAEKVDFVVFMRNGQSIIVPKGNPKAIKASGDLCGKSTTSSMGGSSALEIDRQSKACVAEGKKAIEFQNAVDQEAAYRQLANGRVDFVMDGAASASIRLAKTPEFALAYTLTTDIAAGPVVRKGNDQMLKVVFDGLKAMEARGTLKVLMAKYGLPENLLVPVEIRK